jgi:hypothetical protein
MPKKLDKNTNQYNPWHLLPSPLSREGRPRIHFLLSLIHEAMHRILQIARPYQRPENHSVHNTEYWTSLAIFTCSNGMSTISGTRDLWSMAPLAPGNQDGSLLVILFFTCSNGMPTVFETRDICSMTPLALRNQDRSFPTAGAKNWVTYHGHSSKEDARIGNSPTIHATLGLSTLTNISREWSAMVMKGPSRGNMV